MAILELEEENGLSSRKTELHDKHLNFLLCKIKLILLDDLKEYLILTVLDPIIEHVFELQ